MAWVILWLKYNVYFVILNEMKDPFNMAIRKNKDLGILRKNPRMTKLE